MEDARIIMKEERNNKDWKGKASVVPLDQRR
jgi:hypothetical protein